MRSADDENNKQNCDNLANCFKINIFHIDSYTAKPGFLYDKTYSVYRQKNANVATVVRIFGSTDNGIKVCMHLHQYFPHFSIRQADIAALFDHRSDDEEQIVIDNIIEAEILDIFVRDLETAIRNKSSRDAPYQVEKPTEAVEEENNEHYIYHVESYSAIPIYGYHKSEEVFYRFSFYSTWAMDMAKNILFKGLVSKYPILTHNCLEFLLQFYIDNQIYLNTLYFKNVTLRKTDIFEKMTKSNGSFASLEKEKFKSLNLKQVINDIPSSSTCFLECDTTVNDIVLPVYKNHFPENNDHMPSLPGIIKLWNEQYSRYSKTDGDYEKFISILKNSTKRQEFDIHKPNLDHEILKMIILNYEFVQQNRPPSPTQQNIAVDEVEEDADETVNDLKEDFYDEDEDEEEDEGIMNSTMEELNLLNQFDPNELSRIFFRADNEKVINDFSKINIPQFDGMDDMPEHDQVGSPILDKDSVFYKFGNKKIKFTRKEFGRETIDLSKISFPNLVRSKKVAISEQLKQKISSLRKQIEPTALPILENSKISQLNKPNSMGKLRELCESLNESPVNLLQSSGRRKQLKSSLLSVRSKRHLLNDCRHSTPDVVVKKRGNNCKRKFLTQQFSVHSSRLKLDNIFEDEVLPNITINSPSKLHFSSHNSQTNKTRDRSSDISSLISSNTLTDQSFDLPVIETITDLKWNQCLEITLMSMELHANSRENRLPNPNLDSIQLIAFATYNEILNDRMSQDDLSDSEQLTFAYIGIIVVRPKYRLKREEIVIGRKTLHIHYVNSELDLILTFASYVRALDPDLCVGYVSDTLSWGYLMQRSMLLEVNAVFLLGRITNSYQTKGTSPGAFNSPPQLAGRIVLNAWNLLRHEVALRSYTFENVHYHLFKERISKYTNEHLTSLWRSTESHHDEYSERVLFEYYLTRATGTVKILFHLNFVSRTHGLSCLFGMRFEDVLNRGSQFRVESILLPLCRLENYVPIRFSKELVAEQAAPEWIPLVLEPDTSLYLEPVAVLDFQSLYPSVMIAHNYCFTTCLGKLNNIIRHDFGFGCYQLEHDRDLLEHLQDDIQISPNGVLFVKSNVRKGVLPKMLQDLLYTRILIKSEMKQVSKKLMEKELNPALKRQLRFLKHQLDVCQLGLKLIANVTYGYTSANFTGRMPCIDVADAIVSKGREALENAILYINDWGQKTGNGAKVVYGDTDSVFISFPGSTVKEAFHHANILSQAITSHNPSPMGIKLEKVYQPCFLLSKKRYCGFAFESEDQTKPVFDAKGIETVRRDNCNATSKIIQRCIKILSDSSGDLLQIKPYIQWQIKKIFNGRLSNLNDFIFAKQFRGLKSYAKNSLLPSCILTRQKLEKDPMAEPKKKERVPYVIVAGSPKDRLADLVRDPSDLIADPSMQINAEYYMLRAIFPPLARVLEALPDFDIGMLIEWYSEVRYFRAKKVKLNSLSDEEQLKEFYQTSLCVLCHNRIADQFEHNEPQAQHFPLCKECNDSRHKLVSLKQRLWTASHKLNKLARICSGCTNGNSVQRSGFSWPVNRHACVALTCTNLYRYYQAAHDYRLLTQVDQWISDRMTPDAGNAKRSIALSALSALPN